MSFVRRARRFLVFYLTVSFVLSPLALGSPTSNWIEIRSEHFVVVGDGGEKQVRQTAAQFEQIREVFHQAFPRLRANIGKPVVIFSLKNEYSMKELLPAYWEVKGHAHPAGIYITGEDKHVAVVRVNADIENPYEVVYHEYAHTLEHLNFQVLPLWLSEGLAEFLGYTKIHPNFVEIGAASPRHLAVLRENNLIPLETLFQVDSKSSYYNEKEPAALFYAESWALVHYLLMDREAQNSGLLSKYLAACRSGANPLEAASQSFGSLSKLTQGLEVYSRNRQLLVGRVSGSTPLPVKSPEAQNLSPAEVDALRGDFYTRTHRPIEAKAALETSLQEDSHLALAHEGLGLLALLQGRDAEAEKEFTEAVRFNSNNFIAYYYTARTRMRDQMKTAEEISKVIAELERAIVLNDQFAPAFDALSTLYSLDPATTEKAQAAGKMAMQLEPGTLSYAINYGYVLLRIGKLEDAAKLAATIGSAARRPEDQVAAEQLSVAVASRKTYEVAAVSRVEAEKQRDPQQFFAEPNQASRRVKSTYSYQPPPVDRHAGEDEFAVEGKVVNAECPLESPGVVTLQVSRRTLSFTVPKCTELQILVNSDDVSDRPPPCSAWNGRHARLFFYKLKHEKFFGELSTVQFF